MSIIACTSSSSSTSCLHSHGSNPNLLPHKTQTSFPFPTTNLTNYRICWQRTISRDRVAIYSGSGGDGGLGSPPPPPPETPWQLWVAGVLISAILSIWKTKNNWGPLLKLKEKVEEGVDVVEEVAEMVETAAEGVEKAAEEISEHLPEGSKLQNAALFIENAAERVANDADFAGDIIDKVEELDDEVSSFFKQNGNIKENDSKPQKDQTEALNEGTTS